MAFLGITLEESVTINGKARNAEPSCESQVVGGRRSTCRWMTTETHSDESRLLGVRNFEGNSKSFDGNSGEFGWIKGITQKRDKYDGVSE